MPSCLQDQLSISHADYSNYTLVCVCVVCVCTCFFTLKIFQAYRLIHIKLVRIYAHASNFSPPL